MSFYPDFTWLYKGHETTDLQPDEPISIDSRVRELGHTHLDDVLPRLQSIGAGRFIQFAPSPDADSDVDDESAPIPKIAPGAGGPPPAPIPDPRPPPGPLPEPLPEPVPNPEPEQGYRAVPVPIIMMMGTKPVAVGPAHPSGVGRVPETSPEIEQQSANELASKFCTTH